MKLEKAIKRIENLIKSREDPRGKTELDFALNMAIEALKNIKVIDKIPEDYLYDAETDNFWVYRNKYTGKEIHILKPIDLFVLDRPHVECNQCRYYEGVHGVNGHAPCSFWGIGGVLSSDYCSRFEKEGEQNLPFRLDCPCDDCKKMCIKCVDSCKKFSKWKEGDEK